MTQQFFSEHGFTTIDLPIAPFVHTMKTWQLTRPSGFARFIHWLTISRPAANSAFYRLLVNTRPDVVHLNGLSILPLAPVAKRLGIRVVQHVRESVNEGHFGVRKRWLRYLAKRSADHIVYICVDNQERLTGQGSRSSVIYNPIDFEKFKASSGRNARYDLGIPLEHHVLFFPGGSFFDIKGIIPFLHALAIVRKSYPATCAIIPGLDGTPHPKDRFRRKIEQTIESRDLQTAVLRLPFTTDVEHYYAACDIVVAPFIHPHFSRAVIEAGAMARPVIGSRIGGIQEVLEDCMVGLLAAPNDADDLADKLCNLIANEDRAAAMGQAGYAIARQKYDARNHARAIMKIYDDVLGLTSAA
jgi:glycosyltransferase involved in cell wall biosynthesis